MKENTSAYISMWEKDVVLLKRKGNSFAAIAARYSIPPSEVEKSYNDAADKLRLLTTIEALEQIFPCKTIDDFLDQLGIRSKLAGREVLAECIRFSYLHPKTVDNIAKELIPALAKYYGCTETLVQGRIYSAVKQVYSHSLERGTPAHKFFEMAGLQNRGNINLKNFLLASHDCITELFYIIPAQQKKLYL
ncbi:sporulation initiation factor Spo0A C-terminal domain-containing protein [Lacrimispora brassicae]